MLLLTSWFCFFFLFCDCLPQDAQIHRLAGVHHQLNHHYHHHCTDFVMNVLNCCHQIDHANFFYMNLWYFHSNKPDRIHCNYWHTKKDIIHSLEIELNFTHAHSISDRSIEIKCKHWKDIGEKGKKTKQNKKGTEWKTTINVYIKQIDVRINNVQLWFSLFFQGCVCVCDLWTRQMFMFTLPAVHDLRTHQRWYENVVQSS